MGILNEINAEVQKLEEIKRNAITKISKKCAECKNEKIRYISKSPRIYTINFSDLEDNWSPEYYDFEYQFKAIIYIFTKTSADKLLQKWEQMKEKGIVKFYPSIVREYNMQNAYADLTDDIKNDWYDTSYTILKFHPEVIKFMDAMLLN